MADMFVLQEYYVRYLKEVRGVKDSTVKHYLDALNYISKYLVNDKRIETSVYEITDVGELEVIRTYLQNNPEFKELDKRGHQMYSAGLNNYYKFASGEVFEKATGKIELLDIAMPVKDLKKLEKTVASRSTIIKTQAIKSASYLCEIDAGHKTFIAKNTGNPYMEGHHAIPMMRQRQFDSSLDVYANVVCLCPVCRRLLHYGLDSEKETLVKMIYHDRAERLARSGIRLSQNEFEVFVI